MKWIDLVAIAGPAAGAGLVQELGDEGLRLRLGHLQQPPGPGRGVAQDVGLGEGPARCDILTSMT